LQQAIEDAAPAAKGAGGQGQGSWTLRLNQAELKMSGLGQHGGDDTDMRRATAFDLIAVATLGLRARADRYGYEGRIHSLWFGDIQEVGKYGWYETAFMHSPLIQRSNSQEPFALPPGGDAATALGPAMGTLQLAWPFTPLVIGALDEFIDRWARWFALAAQGQLTPPTEMPERPPAGSWRRS
jgi:serine/threonine-protein kinase